MTKTEFGRAFEIASNRNIDLTDVSDEHLHGCALPGFERVTTTIGPVAKMIRWQCFCLNGGIDQDALNELRAIARNRFELVGPGSDAVIQNVRATGDVLALIQDIIDN